MGQLGYPEFVFKPEPDVMLHAEKEYAVAASFVDVSIGRQGAFGPRLLSCRDVQTLQELECQ